MELQAMVTRSIELIDKAIREHEDRRFRVMLARDRERAIELAKKACIDRYLEDLAAESWRRGEEH